jgi:hypothetical protein
MKDSNLITIVYNNKMDCSLNTFKEHLMYNRNKGLFEFLEHVNNCPDVAKTLTKEFYAKYNLVGFPDECPRFTRDMKELEKAEHIEAENAYKLHSLMPPIHTCKQQFHTCEELLPF